jgi:ribosome-binding factor A
MRVYRGFKRADRVQSLILQILAEHLTRVTSDKRLKDVMFSSVDMTRDLKIAKVYFRFLTQKNPTDETIQGAQSALETAKRHFTKQLYQQMTIKYIPVLRFYYDSGLDHSNMIEGILSDITYSTQDDDS